jgi:hypothetical protein
VLAATRPVAIHVVLLVTEQSAAEEFGRSAHLAISEATQLYTPVGREWLTIPIDDDREVSVQPRFTYEYAGPPAPGLPSALDATQLRELMAEVAVPSAEPSWELSGSCVDQRALIALVGEALKVEATQLVVVTDRLLQAPPSWRYIIWDAVAGGVALSWGTTDPRYWGDRRDLDERRAYVRRRLRAALCSVFGTCLGLVRCDNPLCFLYSDVDRVTRLDHFRCIGKEHRVDALTGLGFAEGTSGVEPDGVVLVDGPPA